MKPSDPIIAAALIQFPHLTFFGAFMLTELYPFLHPDRINADLARRLRLLADDAAWLQETRSVSPALLQSAPLIDEWIIAQTPAGLQLIGDVTGHPRLRGRMAMTSPLWFADPGGRWVRTLSRFYRLGTPADPNIMRQVLAAVARSDAPGDDDGSEGRS